MSERFSCRDALPTVARLITLDKQPRRNGIHPVLLDRCTDNIEHFGQRVRVEQEIP
jgi:hypothetical protein